MRMFIQLGLSGVFAALFVLKPDWLFGAIEPFMMVMMWVFLLLLAGGAGSYIFLEVTGRKAESLGFRVVHDAGLKEGIWVGSKGYNVPLTIRQDIDGLHVAWAGWNYGMIILVTAFMGPGLLGIYLCVPEKFHFAMPFPMLVMASLLYMACWIICIATTITYFYFRPEVVITTAALILSKGGRIHHQLWRQNIVNVSRKEVAYRDDDGSVTNYVLVAEMADGSRVGLCITDRQKQVEELLAFLTARGYAVL